MNKIFLFLSGLVLTAGLAAVLFFFIPVPYSYGVEIIIIGYFGVGGLIYIPIAFKGVPLFLGGRIKRATLSEGWNWILPRPLMNSENVDVKEHTSNPGPITVISQNRVRVTADATIQWAIINPYNSLSIGMKVIEEGMDDLIKQVLRAQIAKKTDEEAISMHEELRNAIENAADKKAIDWGIDIRNILITDIGLEEEVMKDYERTKREERQRDAEIIELNHVRERIQELKDMGFSLERAQEIVQTERGKVKKDIQEKLYGLSGGVAKDIAAKAAGKILGGN